LDMSSALVNSADQYIGVGFFYEVAHHKRVSQYNSDRRTVTSGFRDSLAIGVKRPGKRLR
jgi:hypothetical protein